MSINIIEVDPLDLREMLKTLMLLENPKVDFSLVPYATRTEALKALAAKNLAD